MSNPLHTIKSIFTEHQSISLYAITALSTIDLLLTLQYKKNIYLLTLDDIKNIEPAHIIIGIIFFLLLLFFIPVLIEYFLLRFITKGNSKASSNIRRLKLIAAATNNQTLLSVHNEELKYYHKIESTKDTAICCITILIIDLFISGSAVQQSAIDFVSGQANTIQRILFSMISFYMLSLVYYIIYLHDDVHYINPGEIFNNKSKESK